MNLKCLVCLFIILPVQALCMQNKDEYKSKCTRFGVILTIRSNEKIIDLIVRRKHFSSEDDFSKEWIILQSYRRDIGQALFVNSKLDEQENRRNYCSRLSCKNQKVLVSEKIWRDFIADLEKSGTLITHEEDLYTIDFYNAVSLYDKLTDTRNGRHLKATMRKFIEEKKH